MGATAPLTGRKVGLKTCVVPPDLPLPLVLVSHPLYVVTSGSELSSNPDSSPCQRGELLLSLSHVFLINDKSPYLAGSL